MLLTLILALTIIESMAEIPDNGPFGYVLIKNRSTNLVATDGKDQVTVNDYNGTDNQLWYFNNTGEGRFFIMNRSSGNVLQRIGFSINLKTQPWDGSNKQQWFVNSDETIANAADYLQLDVQYGFTKSGSPLVAGIKLLNSNQKFAILVV